MIRVEIRITVEDDTFEVTAGRVPLVQRNADGRNALAAASLGRLWTKACRDAQAWVDARPENGNA